MEADAVVQCDSCGVAVHEACYGVLGKELEEVHTNDKNEDVVSSTDTMPCENDREDHFSGQDPRPVVNAKPLLENFHSSKPDFRPEFVAHVYKREKMICDYLERMEVAKREREEFGKARKERPDPSRGKPAAKRALAQLNAAKESLRSVMTPFMIHMEKKYPMKKPASPRRCHMKAELGADGVGKEDRAAV
ncbi:hypothetical protein BV898_17623 [Hypsibius exemplaris]|uniref:PHD-type domain-containing protein n=1 Tax=Hypsibius exemplaris TaxID=2072580 RepID=A0A9X6NH73_HYPEX|nr:hypothetical protein BV898_17623 [Hypsibius exemplaris]